MFRERIKNLVEVLIGFEIKRFGTRSFILIDKKEKEDAWFSHEIKIKSIFEKFKINHVIDVGANKGQFALKIRSFYKGAISSFEPVAVIFNELSKTSSYDKQWNVYQLALGSKNTTQTINVSKLSCFSSFFKPNKDCAELFGNKSCDTQEEVVFIRRLDEVIEEIIPDIENKRIFLKMDTQGYDIEVFKGLGNKVKYVLALQSEISLIPIYENMPHWTESISIYERAGFKVAGMFPVSEDSVGRIIEYDCLMIKN